MTTNRPELPTNIYRETWQPKLALDMVELIRLYHSIEEGVGYKSGSVVQIASATDLAHGVEIAYSVAWAGANLLGKRVLFVDLTEHMKGRAATGWVPASTPSPEQAQNVTPPSVQTQPAVSAPRNAGVFSASLPQLDGNLTVVPRLQMLMGVKETFDLLLIASPSVLNNPAAISISGVANGSILLIEPGTSRHRSVEKAVNLLLSGSAPFLGVVMTKRIHSIPRWLRRLFRAG